MSRPPQPQPQRRTAHQAPTTSRRDVALAASQTPQRPPPRRDAHEAPTTRRSDVALAASHVKRHERPRLGGFDYRGRFVYHLVTISHQRRRVLVDDVAVSVVSGIEEAAKNEHFDLLVYCVMPDHVHVLVLGTTDDADVVRFVQRFKQATGFAYKQAHERTLWQQSFYDHVVRSDEDVLPIARYILGNPVVAGLTNDSTEWKFCGGAMISSRATSLHSLPESIR